MRKAIIVAVILSIGLFIGGFYWYGAILVWSLPRIEGVKYYVDTFAGAFFNNVEFSLLLGLIPLCAVLSWKHFPIYRKKNRIFSAAAILLFVVGAAAIKIFSFRIQANVYLNNLATSQINVIIPLKEASFLRYAGLGLLVGCVINYFLFRDRIIPESHA